MRKVHDVGPATGAALGFDLNGGIPVDEVHPQIAAAQHRSAQGADHLDAFGAAGVMRGGGHQAARCALAQFQQGLHMVFGFHAVHTGAAGLGRHHAAHTHQGAKHVQAVDGLGDEDTPPVACQAAATGLVVIALRAPPGNAHRCRLNRAQALLVKQRLQARHPWAKTVLQHHTQLALLLLGQIDNGFGPRQRHIQRLFQQHMFAMGKASLGHL